MTDIQAALGLVQLRRLEQFQVRRHQIVAQYQAAFSTMPELETPVERTNVEHAWHLYVLRLNLEQLTIDRARFIEELKARQIGASVHFIPVHIHPFYREKYGWRAEDFPVAYGAYQRIVSLPLHPRLTDEDVVDVVDAVSDIIAHNRR
jgi:dTDP-4-amino-4,6-dideoxygalactose transaminase